MGARAVGKKKMQVKHLKDRIHIQDEEKSHRLDT